VTVRTPTKLLAAILGTALLGLLAWLALGAGRDRPLAAGLSVAEVLRDGAVEGYARALAPRAFVFPADHGPHPDFRTEWWYFTGNLDGDGGRRFGFQLTFFRSALAPDDPDHPDDRAAPPRRSAWATRQVYLAHFTLTDGEGKSFRSFERFRRGALGLAGAQAAPFRVWLEDWEASGPAAGGLHPLRLRAAVPGPDGAALDLILSPGKPAALQGDRGLSRKGAEPGQASYYYSLTRLPARGTVRSGTSSSAVAGQVWMDREWSTSSLSGDQVGWDWFALQLDDGRELMYYQLRTADGHADPASAGSLIGADGGVLHLAQAEVGLTVLDSWRSPRNGALYPARWRLRIPTQNLDLEIRPLLPDQELDVSFRYWEGAVDVTSRGTPLRGRGYAELTGYAGRPVAEAPR
jgi:predicted secreted hydrolase